MKTIVIINRPVWVGGIAYVPGDVLDVSDNVAGEMCGSLQTGRLFDPVRDAPIQEPPGDESDDQTAKPKGKGKK